MPLSGEPSSRVLAACRGMPSWRRAAARSGRRLVARRRGHGCAVSD
ncbi:MAG: hypothetical protein OZSIB_4256 [Candidatus Ozemobacter sibiricus]|uniref:Uncharacterized protein n=1 Tax=Candidatus Ozemobacter sibiricus TaxID=2268124 RepID=A0A367ZQ49_9BACT|nr:MAG: hypothetical protein OZSIB_4256 [Candidatus Ozemobacter sibiricus]